MHRFKNAMMAAIITVATIALVCGLTITAYSQDRPAAIAVPASTMNIGITTPLTGPMGPFGTQMKNAALLAIEDQNSKGGVTIGGQKYGAKTRGRWF